MTYVSKKAGVILIAVWNVVSVFFEYYMLLRVFKAVPALSIKKIDKERHGETNQSSSSTHDQGSRDRLDWMERENNGQDNAEQDTDALVPQTDVRVPKSKKKTRVFQRIKTKAKTMKVGCQIYMRQTVALPGLSLACLYFTVLSFGSITTGYIYTQNISESILSILRGAGSLFGILATFVFPLMRNKVGLVRSGLFSMSAQFACMMVCLIAIFTPGSPFLLLPDSIRFHGSTVTTHNIHNNSVGNCSMLSTSIAVNHDFIDRYANQVMADNATISNSTSFYTTRPIATKSYFSWSSSSVASAYSSTSVISIRATSTLHSSTATHVHKRSSVLSLPTSAVLPTSSWSASSIVPSPSSTPTIHPSPSVQPRTKNCTVDEVTKRKITYNFSYVSVSLIIAGIILSRFGLWLSDLCITQLQQENVPEEERGIVGAMQKAFNSMLDMSMYVFVIALPKPEEFGFMAIMSVAAVGIGGLMYTRFAYKSRGHLFHFDKIKRVLVRAGSDRSQPASSTHRTPSREILNPEDEGEDEMLNEVLSTRNENFKN